jgi:BirA family biotin operon repressor/biotin-[acetyl-CoA-carboxylase] ligase
MDINKIKESVKSTYLAQNIEFYEEIDSTHIEAKRRKNINKDVVLIAEMQTAGIGTKGRKWNTGKNKNIAISILLHPKCDIKKLDSLTIDIAKVMQKVILNLYGYVLEIKKPNDLILNGKKICGILTEINTIGEKINFLIISLGFNVNEEDFPKEIDEIATSLKKEFKKDFSREEILANFLVNLEEKLVEEQILKF